MSESKPYTNKRYVQLPRPKHAEEYSLEESYKWQPWKVVFKVELSPVDWDPIDYEMYLRADTPDNATYTAYQVFHIWEHVKRPDRTDEYPLISTEVPSESFPIDEDLYKSEWELCKRLGSYLYGGDFRNPTIFRYVPMGWDIPRGIVTPDKPNIIVPDTSAISHVNATRNRKWD